MKLAKNADRAAREAYYQSISAQIAGGTLLLVSDKEEVLATVPFPEDVAIATSEGFTYREMPEVEVKKMGNPVKFQVNTSDGHNILEGTVGVKDSDMLIEEKDARLFPGMKFGIVDFAYNKL